MEPAGRVAIVTGAAVGTGRAIARRLAQAGRRRGSGRYRRRQLIRFTATLAELPGVRVTCVVPDWVGTERAARERAKLPPERWAPWVPLEDFTAEVLALIEDDTAAGRVTVLLPGRRPAVLA